MTDDGAVEVSIYIEAARETVFPYFTDPARYVQWMGGTATLEPTAGGTYRVSMRDGVQVAGTFAEVTPPHRLVFTWGWVHDERVPPGSTRVVVTLTEEGGGTRVLLRHHGLPDEGQRRHHREGWELYLSRLGTTVTGGEPGPDPNGRQGPG